VLGFLSPLRGYAPGAPHLVLGFLSPLRRYAPGGSHLVLGCLSPLRRYAPGAPHLVLGFRSPLRRYAPGGPHRGPGFLSPDLGVLASNAGAASAYRCTLSTTCSGVNPRVPLLSRANGLHSALRRSYVQAVPTRARHSLSTGGVKLTVVAPQSTRPWYTRRSLSTGGVKLIASCVRLDDARAALSRVSCSPLNPRLDTAYTCGVPHLQPWLIRACDAPSPQPRLDTARGAPYLQPRLVRARGTIHLQPRLIRARGAPTLQPRLITCRKPAALHICIRGSSELATL
jgi:hypothetical protein